MNLKLKQYRSKIIGTNSDSDRRAAPNYNMWWSVEDIPFAVPLHK